MLEKQIVNIPLNRVEGDLEVRVQMADHIVADAWCSGTMYRGFEKILVGRDAYDGLVITPRICGICSTAHLTAACQALEAIFANPVPGDAVKIRNLALLVEMAQSDVRQTFLMFAVDFANLAHKDQPLFSEAVRRYRPFQGETVSEVIRETKKLLEIIAIIGGQWPHSSYMVPGGIASIPNPSDLLQCRLLLQNYRRWYENRILGCPIERWLEVKSSDDLKRWLEEEQLHQNSDLGFYLRYSRAIGLDRMGNWPANFLSYGAFPLTANTMVKSLADSDKLIPAGFFSDNQPTPLDQNQLAEHVASSWFRDYSGGRHPFAGVTEPYATGQEGGKYSWAKAPRYHDHPAETGPLAQMIISRHPLFGELVAAAGANAFVRQLARLTRPSLLLPVMETWLSEIDGNKKFYRSPERVDDGEGCGLVEATRGALGHWLRIENGKIAHYQIIPPTTWNASPRDSDGVPGPMEQALIGTEVKNIDNPVELGHIVRSFDPCLVCTVH